MCRCQDHASRKKAPISRQDLRLWMPQPRGIYAEEKPGLPVLRDKGARDLSQYRDVHALQPYQKFPA